MKNYIAFLFLSVISTGSIARDDRPKTIDIIGVQGANIWRLTMKTAVGVLAVIGLLHSPLSLAADAWFQTTVKAMHTRSNGNVAFRSDTQNPSSPCSVKDAWEIHADNINFKQNVAMLMTAYTTRSLVNVQYITGVTCESWGHSIVDQIMLGNFW